MRIPAGLKGRIICIRWFGHTEEESIFGTESGDIKITNDNFLSTGLIPDDSANLKKNKILLQGAVLAKEAIRNQNEADVQCYLKK